MWNDNTSCFAINICRLCANTSDIIVPIFGKEGDKDRIDLKIQKCLPIVVREDDSKPKYVCFTCISKLDTCAELFDAARSSDLKFNSLIQSEYSTDRALELQSVKEAHSRNPEHNTSAPENSKDGMLIKNELRTIPVYDPHSMRALSENQSQQDNNSQHTATVPDDGGVIVLSKMNNEMSTRPGTENQDIVFMVELKYNDEGQNTLTKTHAVQYVMEPQHQDLHKEHSNLSLGSNKTMNINSLNEIQSFPSTKTHTVTYSIDQQPKSYTLTYSTDSPSLHTAKPGLYTTETVPGTSHSQVAFISTAKAQGLEYSSNPMESKPQVLLYTPETQPTDLCEVTYADSGLLKHKRVAPCVASTLGLEESETTGSLELDRVLFLKGSKEVSEASLSPVKAEKLFECTECGKSYRRRANLKAHMGVHTEVRPHCCNQCGASFAVRWDLTLHLRIHNNVFACVFCNKAFSVRSKLERHIRVHTGERPYSCNTCGKAFGDKRNLGSHERTHSSERPFICSTCGRSFRIHAHLKDHQRVHSQLAAYTCDVCGKSFKWKTNLNIHLRVHAGERFPCDECGREFSRRADLSKHKRTHTADRPHACGICGKSYVDKATLQKHVKSHSELKPFACNTCGKTFHYQWYLNSHKKTHLSISTFPCLRCDKVFSKKGNLVIHSKLHASEEYLEAEVSALVSEGTGLVGSN